jgi:hypothetical protein
MSGIEAASGRKAPEATSVSTYTSVAPHAGHGGSGGRASLAAGSMIVGVAG